jgi:anti-sigma B factor antagonist
VLCGCDSERAGKELPLGAVGMTSAPCFPGAPRARRVGQKALSGANGGFLTKGGEPVTLSVKAEERDGWTILQVSGELDLSSASGVRQYVHDAVAEGRRSIVLDLSDVRFCDSSGVGVLIAARRLMRSCAGRLRLILPAQGAVDGSHVNRVFAALGVRRLFEVYSDQSTAVDEAARPLIA